MDNERAPVPVFITIGVVPTITAEDDEGHPVFGPSSGPVAVEVHTTQGESDAYLLRQLLMSFDSVLPGLKPGGQVSVLVTRKGDDGTSTTGSFALNNPGIGRHVWDYRIEERKAVLP